MSYSGGMSQYAHDQENESGLDLAEAWHYEQRRLLNEIHEIVVTEIQNSAPCRNRAAGSCNPIAPRIDAYQQPF